jgi:preprotein translocase subunit SecA
MVRQDTPDFIYKTENAKFNAAIKEIEALHEKGQPVLVGTISIVKSETLASMLKKKGIKHTVLNAKYHEMEAEIVAQAGRYEAVTIATNMAGRGTDIVLGGNPEGLTRQALKAKEFSKEEWDKTHEQFKALCAVEKEKVIAAGGLHILGTERHESRRIDNQLRGRSGRQGDPGSSRFYLSLEDDLLRIFGSDRISGLMGKLGMEEDVPIEHRMVSRAIENAQKKVENHNFEIRKHILEYDDVMNQQRKVIYEQRRQILAGEDLKEEVLGLAEDMLDGMVGFYCPEDAYAETWDITGLSDALASKFSYRMTGIDPHALSREFGKIRHRSGQTGGKRRDRAGLALPRKGVHASGRGPPVEGPPPGHGPPEGGHRPPGLRPEGPAHRVQKGRFRHVRGDEAPHRRNHGREPFPHQGRGKGAEPGHRAEAAPPDREFELCRRRRRGSGKARAGTCGAEGRQERPLPLRERAQV